MSDRSRGVVAATLAALSAAAFFIPYKAAGELAPRAAMVAAMLICAAAFNTSIAAVRRSSQPALSRVSLVSAGVFAVITVVGNVGIAAALSVQAPAITAVIMQLQILIVAGAEWAFLRHRITMRFAAGATLALAGFAAMNLSAFETDASLVGVLFALLAAASFGLMHVITRAVIERIDPVIVNAFRLWLAAAALIAVPGTATDLLTLTPEVWGLAAAAALFGPFLARLAIMRAVRYIAASEAMLVTVMTPIFAFGFGYLVFGSIPTAWETAGGLIIMLGVAIPLIESTPARPAR